MSYQPTPYSEAKSLPRSVLMSYQEQDVSLEIEDPDDEDGGYREIEFTLFFSVGPAEPDVGIMSCYVDDYAYANGDGSPVPEAVWIQLDKIDARDDERKPISKSMDDWHERNCERALESIDAW